MSGNSISDSVKLIVDVLVANERLQFALKCYKSDISDAVYLLYSSALKLIQKVVNFELRQSRFFRLKYHHILSNESIEEYLFHCLSKILSEVLDQDNNYQRFIQPVAELHMKLMSIVNEVQLQHSTIVCNNRKVRQDMAKNEGLSRFDGNDSNEGKFLPVYYLPSNQTCARMKKAQYLTFQAINKHYADNAVDTVMVDMLLDFDNSFAEFELDFVCQVNKASIVSPECAEKTMDVAILFAEAVLWAHSKGLLLYSAIADCDIEMMVGIPRLSVLYGCGVAQDGPLSEGSLLRCRGKDNIELQLAPVFQDHFKELARLRRQLNVLNGPEMTYLSQLLLNHHDLSDHAITSNSLSRLSRLKVDDRRQLVSGDVHAIFKLISSVSDQMQSEHASDYRFFMEVIFKLFKDESDDCQPHLSTKKSHSTPDLFHENVFSSANSSIEEAVEALSYSVVEEQPYSTELCSRSSWALKKCQSQGARSTAGQGPRITDLSSQYNRPQWQDDSSCSRCCHCGTNFNLFRRRHHCRRCGYLFCNSCWGTKTVLPSLGILSQVPVCIECEEFIRGAHKEAAASAQRA